MTTHSETLILPYAPAELYALVTEVERYPEFLPWCAGLRVLKREGEGRMLAEMLVRYKSFTEKFTSRIVMTPPKGKAAGKVEVELVEGPFHHLVNRWEFHPHEKGTEMVFFIDFALNSSLLQTLLGGFFGSAFKKMVAAFQARAEATCKRV